jgi:hypothetical protein
MESTLISDTRQFPTAGIGRSRDRRGVQFPASYNANITDSWGAIDDVLNADWDAAYYPGWRAAYYTGDPSVSEVSRYSSSQDYGWTGAQPAYLPIRGGNTDLAEFLAAGSADRIASGIASRIYRPSNPFNGDGASADRIALGTIYGPPPSNPFNGDGATAAQVLDALDANDPGVTGAGVTVGVISSSFNSKGLPSADLGYGSVLPAQSQVNVLGDYTPSGGDDDEGRAMMQVVHDIAPGASLDFCSVVGTASDQANGIGGSDTATADAILALAAAGCKVICDDVTPTDEPWFQSGVVANAIQTVEQEGVTYVSCAGNQGAASSQGSTAFSSPAYQSTWSPTSVTLDFPGSGPENFPDALNFGNGPFQTITLQPGAYCSLDMQWAQPWGAATTNLALVVSENGTVLQAPSGDYAAWTNGENPLFPGESVDLQDCPLVDSQYGPSDTSEFVNNTGSPISFQISIVNLRGPDPSLVKYMAYSDGGAPISISGENAGTVTGWHESPYQITVGAADAGNTPYFGNSPALSEFFSGNDAGTEWLYARDGSPYSSPLQLSPIVVTGVDDINCSDVVGGTDYSGIPDFFGTSCATPSVAAIVALMLQANPNLTPSDIQTLLAESALPMANPYVSGAGLVRADLAVAYAGGGSSRSAVLLQNTDGQAAVWDMNGTNIIGGGTVSINPGPSWLAIGTGDFGGGSSDILWQNIDGQAAVWEMNGTNPIGGGTVSPNPGPSWLAIGTGDFNGDGLSDILWQNIDGQAAIWEMNGNNVIGGGTVSINPGPGWKAIGTGDFNDDGLSDILWQNANGQVAIWEMNGNNVIGGGTVRTNPGPGWQAIGSGDLTGDGHSDDILWQNTDGQVAIWEMNGNNLIGGGVLNTNPGPSWRAVGTTGGSDIMFQNTDGQVAIWDMNGTNIVGGGTVNANPGSSWRAIRT